MRPSSRSLAAAGLLLCWIQPSGPAPTGWALTVAGMPVPITPTNHGPDVSPGGVAGDRWCADVPAVGTFEWGLSALWAGGEVPGVNSPQTRYRSAACRSDLDANGAVDLGDVSAVLAQLGSACEVP